MAKSADDKTSKRVLAVVTSTPAYESCGYRTGLWLGELTHFYDVMEKAGHEVTIASIDGGLVPLDPESLGALVLKQGGTDKRYRDREFMALLDDTVSIDTVSAGDYDAVYLTGGHGTMFDFATSAGLAKVVVQLFKSGGVVSAVCHGPAGFLGVQMPDGTSFLKGRTVTGFSWAEEKLARRADFVPFRLDEKLRAQGAKYKKAVRPLANVLTRMPYQAMP